MIFTGVGQVCTGKGEVFEEWTVGTGGRCGAAVVRGGGGEETGRRHT